MALHGLRESGARSVTLLRAFLVASAAILAVGGLVLTQRLGDAVRRQAIDDQIESVTAFANDAVGPGLVDHGRIVVTPQVAARLRALPRTAPDVKSIKIWQPDGTLAFATFDPSRIGTRFPVDGDLTDVVQGGKAVAFIENLARETDPENRAEARAGITRALTVYAPIFARSGRVVGAYEVYRDPGRVDAVIASSTRTLAGTVAAVFAALILLLAVLVTGASRRLRSQTAKLRESYALLEASSLETIETLNATVEAKDPYTAGHSQRVRAIALAIGRELGLAVNGLDTLGTSALFHDVGKIAVPDAILTKPGRLTPEEFELVKLHSAKGAEIVSRLSRLKDAVPAILHHHERWDGRGYPDGLAGEEIPLAAAIIGLADAWDAMTTVRPYSDALPFPSALAEIHRGRGTQFAPRVVDAFLRVAATLETDAQPLPPPALRSVAAG